MNRTPELESTRAPHPMSRGRFPAKASRLLAVLIVVLGVFAGSFTQTKAAPASADYSVLHNAFLAGGGRSESADFLADISFGDFGGLIQSADAAASVWLGNVGQFNRSPILSGLADTTANGGSSPVLNFTVSDPESAPSGVQLSASASDPVLIPAGGIILGGAATDRTIQLFSARGRTGSAVITVRATDEEGLASTNTFNVGVTIPAPKLIPEVTWPTPASMVFGTLLGPSQLNATANVPGTFTYTPASGTKPNAGSTSLSVTFVPNDAENYQTSANSVSLTVTKAPLTIRAENKFKREGEALPALTAVYTGFVTPDTSANLDTPVVLSTTANASSSLGSYPITASGASDANYTITHVNGTLTVTTRLLPTITWSNPAAITYGTVLTATQLNATADVAGSFSYNPPAGTVLGAGSGRTLSATFTPNDTLNYEPLTVVVGIDVLKAPLTVRADDQSKVYGAALPALTATLSGFVNGDTAASLDMPVSLTTTAAASSNAGTYTITPAGASDVNYAISFEAGTLTVTKAALTIRAEDQSKVYGAALPALTASYTGLVNGDTATSLDTPVSLSTTATGSSNAGTYPITASGAADANYTITFASGTLTVSKAALTIRAEDQSKAYGAALPALTVSYTGFVNQDAAASLDNPVSLSTSVTASSNAGAYPITASGASDANYSITFEPGTMTVTPAALAIRAEDKSKVYGEALPALTVSYSGFVNQDSAASLDSPVSLSTSATAASNAGSYPITASGATDANYTITFEPGTLTVSKAALTVRAEDKSKVYGAALPALTASYSGFVNQDTAAGLDSPVSLSTSATASSNVGSYPINVSGASDANYTITFEPGTLTVSKAALTIRAEDKFMRLGDALPVLTASYTGFVNQDTAASLDVPVSLSTTANASSPLGNYPITASGASDANYAISHVNGTLSVTSKLVPVVTWSNPAAITYGTALTATQLNATADVAGTFSYNPAMGTILAAGQGRSLSATFTPNDTATYESLTVVGGIDVLKAPLTVRAEDKSKVYGAALPALTVSYSGFVNQDGTASLDSPVSLSTSASAASSAGSYPITASGAADANYTITFETGTLTVSKAALTIRAEDKSKVYGAALPALTASYSGFVNQDGASNLDSPVSLTTTATASSSVGSYPITAAGASDANYTITFEPGTMTVSKAVLTIRAENQSKIYGAALSALTALYIGLVNQDTEASLDSPVNLSTTATASSNAGSYPITASVAADANYTISFEAGTLTVSKAPLTIRAEDKSKVYGAALPALTASYSGFVNQDSASSLDSPVSLSTSATASSNAGAYAITPSGASDANYAITFEAGTLTVSKAPLTIRAEDQSKVYGAAVPTLTASYSGFVNQDSASSLDSSVSLTTTATASSNVGSYPITVAGASDVNYTISFESGTLTVSKAALTIRAEDKFMKQGGALPVLTAGYTGFVNQDTPESLDGPVALSTTAVASSAVGSYPITASGASDANYTISHVNGTLTVSAKFLPAVTWSNPAAITYGTALSATQLNASADVAGTFSYNPPLGTVLGAGQGKSLAATFTPNDTATYESVTVVVGIDVLKAPLTVRAEDKSKVYGAALPALTVSYTGFVNQDAAASLDSPVSLSTSATASSAAGTYPITAGGASDANYTITFEPGTLTVTKAALAIKAESKSKVYGADLTALTASYTGFVNQDSAASLDSPVSLTTSATAASNVGTYPITAGGAADANYTISFEAGTLTVSKAALTIRAEDKSKVYGAALPALTASYTGLVNQDTAASLDTPVSLNTTATAASNAGTYPITISGGSDANYTTTLVPGALTVSPASLTIRADDQSKVYGAALPALTATYSGFVNQDTAANLDSPVSLSTSATASSPAGDYPITLSGAADANYAITLTPGTLTVTRAALTIRAEDKSKVYGAALPALTASYTGFVNQDTAASLDAPVSLSTSATASSGVGSYAIKINGASDANYTIAFEPGTLSVSQATLSIRAEDKFVKQGETLPLLTAVYTGFVNQDTPESLDAPVILSTTASAASAVGSYPIAAGGASDVNYTITHLAGTLTVTTKLVPRITWANPAPITYGTALGNAQLNATADIAGTFSYNPPPGSVLAASQGQVLSATFTPGDPTAYETLTVVVGIDVLKAALTIRAEDKSKVYGAALPELTATYTGFVNADTASSLEHAVSLSTSGTASSNVGSYPITASGASDANYAITFEPGTLTVSPAALTIRAEDKSKVYGAAVPALTASYAGLVNNDTAASLDNAVTLSTTGTASSSVGTFPITASGATDANYTITFSPGTLTVTKAALTIRADDKSKVYGAALPALTASYSGLVNEDTAASLDTSVSLSTTATAASNAGAFAITASGASDANYTITFEPGTLTVTKAALIIRAGDKTKAYGAAVPPLTVFYTGFANQDTAASLDNPVSLSTTARTSSNAGTYPITVSGASDANYAIIFEGGTMTVAKVPLTIRAENKSKVYGAALPALTASYTGFVNQDTAAKLDSPVTLTTTATASSRAGSYPITASGAGAANYIISFEAGTLTVTKAPLTIRAEDKFKKQGEALPLLTASYAGFVNQDTVENLDIPATLSTTASASSPVGNYPITAGGAADDNYAISHLDGALTVTARLVPRVNWPNPTPIVYGTALGSTQLNATADVAGSFSYNPPAGTVLGAGQGRVLAATFTPSDPIAYESVTVAVRLDVLKAPLTIRADDKSKAYGAAFPALTASFSGFVNGDTAASLDHPVSVSTSAVLASSVGSYPIVAGEASDANYAITFAPGTLTVTQAALTVTPKNITRRFGEPNPSLTGIIRGLKNSDPISATYATTATEESPLGTYPIPAVLADPGQKLPNYSVTVEEATLTVQLETTFTGVAQDGYVSGAVVFFDANKNGEMNANEPSTHTDSRGSFDLVVLVENFDTNANGVLDPAEGTIVLAGGVDISTGIPLQTALTAPPGSTVVSPLTTLLSATIESNPSLTLAESKAKLNQALGLPQSVELTTYDPIVAAAGNDGRAKDVLSAGAKVQDTLVQISTLVTSGDAASKSQAASAVIQAMASSVTAGTSINLDQSSVVNGLIQQSATLLGQTVSTQIKEGAAQIIAGANQVKTDIAAATGNALEAAQQLSQSQVTGRNVVTAVLEQVASGAVSIDQAVTQTDKTAVAQAAQSAQAGDVTGTDERPGTFVFSQSAYQMSASKASITLNRSEGNFGEVTLVISLKNSSGAVAATASAVFSSREMIKTVDLLPTLTAAASLAQQELVPVTLALAPGAPEESALGSLVSATVTVRIPPQIVQQPSGRDVTRGSSTTIAVVATGTPAPAYQWQRNGVNLPGRTGSSLTLSNVSDSDAGTYRVVVSNNQGSVTSAGAEVRVISAPGIVRQPAGQDLLPGGSLTMTVVAKGTPAPSYQWFKNGVPLLGQVSSSLTLNAVTASEAGRYQVEVRNSLGSVLSDPAEVMIVSSPVITAGPTSKTGVAGTPLVLQVSASGTGLIYQWEKDGQPIPTATQSLLTVPNAQESDSGEYRVTIHNIAGTVSSAPAVVRVYRPLVFLVQPQGQKAQAGTAATLTAQAGGTGPLTYQWFKDGRPIKGAIAAQLAFNPAQLSDAGPYHVEIASPFGALASARVQFDVFAPPTITRHPLSRTVLAGDDVRFEVEVSGSQPLTYQWLKDGAPLAGAQATALLLKSVQARDAGGYAVRVSNAYGNALSVRADLTVVTVEAPAITVQPQSQTVTLAANAVFQVSAVGSAPLSYQWFKDGTPIAGATTERLELSAVKLADAGEYTVAVSNAAGGAVSAAAVLKVQQKIRVRGDLDGDGHPDIVLEDDKGFLAVWLLQEARMLLARFLEPGFTGDAGWRVAASGDWNADGQEDLLFQHADGTLAVWLLDGIALQTATLLQPGHPGDPKWRVVGSGDLNADGRPDLVFAHADGSLAVWLMDGIRLQEARLLEPARTGDIQWQAMAVADFNGDGKDDLVFQHRDGTIGVWLMDGTKLVEATLFNPERPNGEFWEVAGAADWDRDGQTDLLLRRPTDGALAIWFLNGTRLTSARYLTPLSPGGAWKPTAPR